MLAIDILEGLEQNLFLPKSLISCQLNNFTQEYIYKVQYGIIDDCSILSCGCCLSESLHQDIVKHIKGESIRCPVCDTKNVSLICPVKQLRSLYKQIHYYRETLRVNDEENNEKPIKETSKEDSMKPIERFNRKDTTQMSLLALFHKVASKFNNQPELPGKKTDSITQVDQVPNYAESEDAEVLDTASNTRTIPISQDSINLSIKNTLQDMTRSVSIDEEKEYFFAQCFPIYRKRSQFNTHPKFLRTKSKLYVNMAISPDCSKFALITEQRWEIHSIRDGESPILLYCGKSTGEYGPDFDHLRYPDDRNVLTTKGSNPLQKDSWEHIFCKLSNDFFVISGTKKRFRVFDLAQNGQPVHTYASAFPIRCIDIDSNSDMIACGITGRDRLTGAEQALIVFHRIERNKVTSEPEISPPTTITLPYRDPINTLQFSDDGFYLSCSTTFESRFLIISLRKFNEPRLIMKSLRSIDTSLESEGITDVKLFPGNPGLMCVTSAAFNAPPIVVNTKIKNIDGLQSVAQPTMLIRLEELGSSIHKCEISPRNDSIAFLDRNGSVYIMFSPTMVDSDKRRIVLVDMVSNAYRAHESAALRFSSDGHKLYILDRKGILHVEDFSYGLPQGHEVTKCKEIN